MRDVANLSRHADLDRHKEELENQIRSYYSDYDRAALKALPIIQAYTAYSKRFKKTYHVLLQLKSVAFKGKSIPRVAGLVEAMFMAELKNLLLTAVHDLDAIQKPITIDVWQGDERFIRMNGKDQVLKPGDMMITDASGVISNVIYGSDRRTRAIPETRHVFFSTYRWSPV